MENIIKEEIKTRANSEYPLKQIKVGASNGMKVNPEHVHKFAKEYIILNENEHNAYIQGAESMLDTMANVTIEFLFWNEQLTLTEILELEGKGIYSISDYYNHYIEEVYGKQNI